MPVIKYGNHEFLTKIEENRDRLADDAVLLISKNRLKSAHALLILSMEEQGKLLVEI